MKFYWLKMYDGERVAINPKQIKYIRENIVKVGLDVVGRSAVFLKNKQSFNSPMSATDLVSEIEEFTNAERK